MPDHYPMVPISYCIPASVESALRILLIAEKEGVSIAAADPSLKGDIPWTLGSNPNSISDPKRSRHVFLQMLSTSSP